MPQATTTRVICKSERGGKRALPRLSQQDLTMPSGLPRLSLKAGITCSEDQRAAEGSCLSGTLLFRFFLSRPLERKTEANGNGLNGVTFIASPVEAAGA